jgi:hypothetical protein
MEDKMKESDYISATNLAKVSAAKNIMLDFFANSEQEKDETQSILRTLSKIETRLFDEIIVDQDDGNE